MLTSYMLTCSCIRGKRKRNTMKMMKTTSTMMKMMMKIVWKIVMNLATVMTVECRFINAFISSGLGCLPPSCSKYFNKNHFTKEFFSHFHRV